MEWKNIFEICEPKQWKTISTSMLTDEGYPVYGANGVIGCYSSYNHEEPTLMITCRGATCGEIHICQPKSYITGNAMALDNLSAEVDIRYLYFFLKNYDFNQIISGSAQPQITRTGLRKMMVGYPPLQTQQKIVQVLDKAQSLIDKRKEQIELMDELIQSTFYEMFGDPVVNPKGWRSFRLDSFISFLTSGSRGWAKYYSTVGELFIRIQNVKNGRLNFVSSQYVNAPKTQESKRTKVQEKDLIISITADLGRTAVVDKYTAKHGAYINQHLCLLRLNDDLNPYYASFYLESAGGKNQIQRLDQVGVKSGLNFDSIKSLNILVPPSELQNQFAEIVQKIDAQKQLMEQSLTEMENNYNSLMQRAFSVKGFN